MTVFNHLNIIMPKVLVTICALSTSLLCLMIVKLCMLPEPSWHNKHLNTSMINISQISESDIPANMNWKIFTPHKKAIRPDRTPVEELYILRGTFLVNTDNGSPKRKAIIDDLKNSTQIIINESQELQDGRKILSIANDHIILLNGTVEEILTLPFSTQSPTLENSKISGTEDQESLTDRYGGKQVGKNEWSFKKSKIMEYYEELMADPKRLLNLFDSFEPVYNDKKKITGYKINIKGEKDFINAVGLQNGDYITRVNALRLTNRKRAEYMIGEFLEGRAGTFALEVERNDTSQRFLYKTY